MDAPAAAGSEIMTRIVVIGGVAAGMSAASQAKRRNPQAEVIALERGPDVSYGACGIPYNLEDPARAIQDLVVISAERFRSERGIEVRLQHEALAIDPARKRVRVRDRAAASEYEQAYDKLVIATGASAVRPPWPGLDLPGVHVLRELSDGAAIKSQLAGGRARRAVIVGGGYIGMEMAEALRTRGLEVTVLERAGQVVPGFAAEIAALVHSALTDNQVAVHTGVSVQGIVASGAALQVNTDQGSYPAELVLVAVGVRPNVVLAQAAGIVLGASGAIATDDHQRTNLVDIFAAGDCCEALHRVSGRPAWIPLGTTANKQGKVAGANAAGADERFAGIVGTAGFRVFDLEIGRTGLAGDEIGRLQLDAVAAPSRHASRAHRMPGSAPLTTVLFVERGTGRLLGAQMAGRGVVAKRIDVLATALHAGMSVADVEDLDLSYAPPLAPVYDPVLIAASVARKALGR